MERHISLSEIEAAVKEVYEKFKDYEVDGEVDPRLHDVDPDKFGIAVMLTDGRTVKVGDTDVAAPMGTIVRMPVYLEHRLQKLDETKKVHFDKRSIRNHGGGPRPEGLPISANGIRLVSKIQPTGDADGKYAVISDRILDMMGSAPVLDDTLYESMTKTNEAADVENMIARSDYPLYDDAPIAIDIYTRLVALQASASQLAVMGATLAADGRNPLSGEYAFDGIVAPRVVAYMAAKGPHHLARPWLIKSGLPALSSFGGSMLGVLPGVMAVAAYSPVVNDDGVSVRAYKAMSHLMKRLGISVFGSEKVVVD